MQKQMVTCYGVFTVMASFGILQHVTVRTKRAAILGGELGASKDSLTAIAHKALAVVGNASKLYSALSNHLKDCMHWESHAMRK